MPALTENTVGSARVQSVRERLEAHRSNPVCASCHRQMDPLGFALENFDAIGRYRTMDGESPVDPTGVMPDGTRLDGPSSLRAALTSRTDAFAEAVTERLMTYALGRGVEFHDGPAIRRIVHAAAANGYRWSSLVEGIARSVPFVMRGPDPKVPESQSAGR